MKTLAKVQELMSNNQTQADKIKELETKIDKLNKDLKEFFEIKRILGIEDGEPTPPITPTDDDNKDEVEDVETTITAVPEITETISTDIKVSDNLSQHSEKIGDDRVVFDDEVTTLEEIESPFEKEINFSLEEEPINPFDKEVDFPLENEVENPFDEEGVELEEQLQPTVTLELLQSMLEEQEHKEEIQDIPDVQDAPDIPDVQDIQDVQEPEATEDIALSVPATIYIKGREIGNPDTIKKAILGYTYQEPKFTPKTSEIKQEYSKIAKVLNRKTLAVIRDIAGADKNNTIDKDRRYSYLEFLKHINSLLVNQEPTPTPSNEVAEAPDTVEAQDVSLEVAEAPIDAVETVVITEDNKSNKDIKNPFENSEVFEQYYKDLVKNAEGKAISNIPLTIETYRETIESLRRLIDDEAVMDDFIYHISNREDTDISLKSYEEQHRAIKAWEAIKQIRADMKKLNKKESIIDSLEALSLSLVTQDYEGEVKLYIRDIIAFYQQVVATQKWDTDDILSSLRIFNEDKDVGMSIPRNCSAIPTKNYPALKAFMDKLKGRL